MSLIRLYLSLKDLNVIETNFVILLDVRSMNRIICGFYARNSTIFLGFFSILECQRKIKYDENV